MNEQKNLNKEDLLQCISRQKSVFLVCGSSFLKTKLYEELKQQSEKITLFIDFSPNPEILSVKKGIEAFRKAETSIILAAGGGSAMDVAKSVKAYAEAETDDDLEQEVQPNNISLIAIPTTAGSGSEATHFAVIYKNGVKCSVAHPSLLPEKVALLPELLESLPDYQRKTTMLDAFCHGIESFWSVKSTEESRQYAKEAIGQILQYYKGYLENTPEGNEGMLAAAHKAGQAINLTQTTAAHAMSYKLTSLYGISHGHSAALCLSVLWPFMWENRENCVDPRGQGFVEDMFVQLAEAMGEPSSHRAIEKFTEIFTSLDLSVPEANEEEISVLTESVNIQRLQNNPIALSKENIQTLYRKILKVK